mgnify:CR=1 FL=1
MGRSKYRNVRTEVDGITFDSRAEAKGMKTPVYKLKKKLVEACYPDVKIMEIR